VILAIDTTSDFGSIALVDAARVVDEVALHSPDGFAHILFDEIARLLDRHGIGVQEIDCFAAASGPGSFTGVRIGLTTAKGLAEMTGKRVAAVSNLQALAWFGSADLRATVLDARRGEIYGAVYDRDLNLRSPETVMKFQEWIKTLPAGPMELISTDPGPFAPSLPHLSIVASPRALAGAVGLIGLKRHQQGITSDPSDVDANYVRRSDAELLWKQNF
jgi:tRNA threonylcarbamoyladenosine biosynthesis protein TsaB